MRSKQLWTLFLLGLAMLLLIPTASAEEGGAFMYAEGAETVMPGAVPPPGNLIAQTFTMFYSANRFNDSNGKNSIPDFRVAAFANCIKFKYVWKTKVLGGNFVTGVAPVINFTDLNAGGANQAKFNLANNNIDQYVAYHKGSLFWQYGLDIWTPGPSYKREAMVNIGQHYWEFEPVFAITWLPGEAKSELSWRFQYDMATTNPDNHYHSGNYISTEFAAAHNFSKQLSVGFNGWFAKQVRDDTINGAIAGDGNRSQVLAVGPKVQVALGNSIIAFKYFRETEVRFHPVGNEFWFEAGIPLWHRAKK